MLKIALLKVRCVKVRTWLKEEYRMAGWKRNRGEDGVSNRSPEEASECRKDVRQRAVLAASLIAFGATDDFVKPA